jgi:hypothetical protein
MAGKSAVDFGHTELNEVMFCDQCGSSSRDMDGFCRGCGAPLSSEEPANPVSTVKKSPLGTATPMSAVPPIFVSDRLTSKNVWVAALLALFLGPPGMIYSTPIGALVMSVVSIPVWFFGGALLALACWLACIIWAVMAARD